MIQVKIFDEEHERDLEVVVNNFLSSKDYSTIILPLISANKCIGVLIVEDANARQNTVLYSLICSLAISVNPYI